YEFHFSYPDQESYAVGISCNGSKATAATDGPSRQELHKKTNQLVRRLLTLTQSLEPLPENAYITMRLFYSDNCPIEYEPPSFKPCTLEYPDNDMVDIRIGNVATKVSPIR
ncbi:DNA binding protein, partial [Kappamyces sp. JEL0680]